MKSLFRLFVVLLAFAAHDFAENAQDGWEVPTSEAALTKSIEQEIKTLRNHPWAGSYYEGDGTGVNIRLTLAPQAGFAITWHGCLGLYGHNFGTATEKDGQIILVPSLPNKAGEYGNFDTEYLPVRWGNRRYLIPSMRVAEFCNQVNGGFEPREISWGLSLLRQGDEKTKVAGLPELPDQYKKRILSKPINARILSIGSEKTRPAIIPDFHFIEHEIVVDAGANAGVFEGLEFHVVEPDMVFGGVTISAVEPDRSTGTYTYTSDDKQDQPRDTWKMSTRPSWVKD